MLRANGLTKLTQTLKCCKQRGCIPMCTPACEAPISTINRSLLQWQMWQRHMPAPKPKPKVCCQTPRPYKEYMPDYTMADLKRKKCQRMYLSCYHPPKKQSERISAELRTLLDRYAARPPIPFKEDPLYVDSGPLASYLHSVMQQDGVFNQMYDIDFYDNNEPSYAALQRALEQQLNPFSIGDLFAMLRADMPLTPEQMQQLLDFLLALSHMSPDQLAAYLHQLAVMGLLTPDVLFHLQKILAENPQLRSILGAAQLDMLTKALNKVADEVAAMIALQKLREEQQRALDERITRSGSGRAPPIKSGPTRFLRKKPPVEQPVEQPQEDNISMKSIPSRWRIKPPKKPDGDNISMKSNMSKFSLFGGDKHPEKYVPMQNEYHDYVNAIIHNVIPSSRRWPIVPKNLDDKVVQPEKVVKKAKRKT